LPQKKKSGIILAETGFCYGFGIFFNLLFLRMGKLVHLLAQTSITAVFSY